MKSPNRILPAKLKVDFKAQIFDTHEKLQKTHSTDSKTITTQASHVSFSITPLRLRLDMVGRKFL